MNNLEEIKEKYPSICYNCRHSRKPASNENTKKGYVGCCIRVLNNEQLDWTEINEAEEIGEGWVDLKSDVTLDKGSGVITNFQLLTLKVNSCDQYTEKY